ncbi:hypothetical protein EYF80_008902 [Liparis tanakae]|uniref:Uncharacterized protein n=1 Tax=Liparis tanakae TaxID=230148 RepID=A0A4Z2IT04_9TELE|nr:hypothetical protein EYF80_008902 [Liparis tanakae]
MQAGKERERREPLALHLLEISMQTERKLCTEFSPCLLPLPSPSRCGQRAKSLFMGMSVCHSALANNPQDADSVDNPQGKAQLQRHCGCQTLLPDTAFHEPDTLESCDLGCSTHFLLAMAADEVKTVKGQWLTSPASRQGLAGFLRRSQTRSCTAPHKQQLQTAQFPVPPGRQPRRVQSKAATFLPQFASLCQVCSVSGKKSQD